jgi:CubicO group peptidase (beta-lactamase class C family)
MDPIRPFPQPAPGARRSASRRDLLVAMALACWSGLSRPVPAIAARQAAPAAAGRPMATGFDTKLLDQALARAATLPSLHALLVARAGEERVAQVFRGPGLDRPVNIKSVSKSVMAALAGAAIERGILAGVDQRVAPILGDLVPADADPRVGAITIDHLLTMRAGLERTSGPNYGRWVSSPDWVRHVLSRPFVDQPGGRMLYSTGSYHLLSAVLTRAAGRSTLELARAWLGEPLGIEIPPWPRDPQGFYLGGNNMLLAPRALLRFGEAYRLGAGGDSRILPRSWIAASWTPRTRSRFTGHHYGYGWFIAQARGHPVYYAWGYGGQMIYLVPDLALTVVMTSNDDAASARGGHVQRLHALMAEAIIPAAARA